MFEIIVDKDECCYEATEEIEKELKIVKKDYATLAAAANRLVEAKRWVEEARAAFVYAFSDGYSNIKPTTGEELIASNENASQEFEEALAEV